jgi:hypothetical protein
MIGKRRRIKIVPPGAKEPKLKKQKKNLCPFVRSPSLDCYCRDMNSSKISMAIHFCQNHYVQCPIYKRMIRPKTRKFEVKKKARAQR